MKSINIRMHQLEKRCPEMVRLKSWGREFRLAESIVSPYKLFTFKREDKMCYITVGALKLSLKENK